MSGKANTAVKISVNVAARNLSDRRYLPKKISSKKVYNRKKINKYD